MALSVSLLGGGLVWAGQPAGQQGVRIVEVGGKPAEIGRQHGQQLQADIQYLNEHYLQALLGNPQTYRRALTGALIFRAQLLGEHREELAALAEAAGMDSGDAMLAQCFLDLDAMVTCSTITLPADASPDHVARFGRNLDFPGLNVADKYSLLMIVRPEGRYAFAAVSWPGLMGVLSGMNEHGLTLTNMEVTRPQRLPQAMPYAMLYRMVLEQCRTVDEAVAMLEKTPKQTANNLMLMDAAGNRAVVEIQPEKITVRRGTERKALISTNHQRGQDADRPGRCDRYDLLHDRSAGLFGKIDAGAIEKMLGQVAQGNETLQSMVFEPANRVIYLATGAEATKRGYQKIELKGYFEKKRN
jgi:isopenicillin-N N-acyltransferase like protein